LLILAFNNSNSQSCVPSFQSEGDNEPERIYTVFLGSMVKPQEVTAAYDHYSVLRTIEDNFWLDPIHKDSGDGAASVITGIWK
jgi:hypothetical protein